MRTIGRTLVVAGSVLVGCGGAPGSLPRAANAEPSPLDPVRFLVGDWFGPSPEGTFDEHWVEPRGGVMLGVGREIAKDGHASFFEYMRIEARADSVFLVPQPGGKAGHDFKLVKGEGQRAVFESAGDDRVRTISYARSGDALEVRVQGTGIDDAFRLTRAR